MAANAAALPSKPGVMSGTVGRLLRARETVLLLIVVIECIAVALATPAFVTNANLQATIVGLCWDMLIAVGMTMILIAGAFDLSVGSSLAVIGVLSGLLLKGGVPTPAVLIIGLAVAILFGGINAFMITRANVNPMITTLGTMAMGRGLTLVLSNGSPIMDIPKDYTSIAIAQFLGLPFIIWITILAVIVGDLLMRQSAFFRQLYFVGGNEKAALLSGINVNRMKWVAFIITAFLAGIAGLLTTSYFTVALPTAGTGAEFRVITACVIGGCSLKGGVGTVLGSLLGMIFVAVANDAMVILNVSVYIQQLITGLILITAVVIDSLTHK